MISYKKFIESLHYSNLEINIADYHVLIEEKVPIDIKLIDKLLSDIKPILNKIKITYNESDDTGNGPDTFDNAQEMLYMNRNIFSININSKSLDTVYYTNLSISKIPDDWYLIGYYHRLSWNNERMSYFKIDSYGGLVKFLLDEAEFPN